MRRSAVAAAILASACSAPPAIRLTLPPEITAPDVHAIVVALERDGERSAQLVDLDRDRARLASLIPGIAAWDEEPAAYTVLTFPQTIAELDVSAGPIAAPADGVPTVTLPTAAHVYRAELSVEPVTTWVSDVPVPPALATITLARASQPVDCDSQFVRSINVRTEDTDVEEVVATSRDTALLGIRESGSWELAELQENGVSELRPLPDAFTRVRSLATDGASAWATDDNDRLLLLDLHGAPLALSAPGVARRVVPSTDLRVHGWHGRAIFTVVAGSTTTTAWPADPAGPPDIDGLAVAASGDAVVIDTRGLTSDVWVRQGGRWRNELTPAAEYGEVTSVAADELGYYAVTGAALFRRLVDETEWSVYPDVGTFERSLALAYGGGRLAVVGIGGFIEVAPNVPPYGGWCRVTAGTLRELERMSIDPSRTTMFATDRRDTDGSEPRALVLQVTLPR